MAGMPDHFYEQVTESIKSVFDLTARIDERVKKLVEQHNEANQRIERIMERHENMSARVSVLENKNGTIDLQDLRREARALEIKVAALEIHQNQHENKWKLASDFFLKVVLAVIGGIIAFKLNN